MNLFDLNIEKVLDNWSNAEAIREIIANALDEKELSHTRDIVIGKDDNGAWHVTDFGRGIKSEHFTQNESSEKKNAKNLIGKFGVGLKDALGVLFNNNVTVIIDSKYGHITLKQAKKEGFDIETLHAAFEEPLDDKIEGTDFTFIGLKDEDVEKARQLFLAFNGESLLETTKYGQVYRRTENHPAYIYISGVKVAEEENFMFSYNITELNKKIKDALNRERANVGRSAYTESVKKILLSATANEVLTPLLKDLQICTSGKEKEETTWTDIAVYAAKRLNSSGEFVFTAPQEINNITNSKKEIISESGKEKIILPDNVLNKIRPEVKTVDDVFNDYKNSFRYDFVCEDSLTEEERSVFALTDNVKSILKEHGYKTDVQVKISTCIRVDESGKATLGVFENEKNRIIIKRSALENVILFLKVLLHEFCHSQHNYEDNTRDFENDLSDLLGIMTCLALTNRDESKN